MERWGLWSNLHVHMNSLLVRRNWGELCSTCWLIISYHQFWCFDKLRHEVNIRKVGLSSGGKIRLSHERDPKTCVTFHCEGITFCVSLI